MNLYRNPTREELADLIGHLDPADYVIIWADHDGAVRVQTFTPTKLSGIQDWLASRQGLIALRLSTLIPNSEAPNVGPLAAADESWTEFLLRCLIANWPPHDVVGIVDRAGRRGWR